MAKRCRSAATDPPVLDLNPPLCKLGQSAQPRRCHPNEALARRIRSLAPHSVATPWWHCSHDLCPALTKCFFLVCDLVFLSPSQQNLHFSPSVLFQKVAQPSSGGLGAGPFCARCAAQVNRFPQSGPPPRPPAAPPQRPPPVATPVPVLSVAAAVTMGRGSTGRAASPVRCGLKPPAAGRKPPLLGPMPTLRGRRVGVGRSEHTTSWI